MSDLTRAETIDLLRAIARVMREKDPSLYPHHHAYDCNCSDEYNTRQPSSVVDHAADLLQDIELLETAEVVEPHRYTIATDGGSIPKALQYDE